MKKITLAAFLFLIGCQAETLEVPEEDGSYALISHFQEPILTFVDMKDARTAAESTLPFPLTAMEKGPENEWIVANKYETDLLHINLDSGEIRTLFEGSKGMEDLVYHEENDVIYIADSMNNEVHLIDAQTGEHRTSIAVGSQPLELAVDDADVLFVLNGGSNEVTVIDTERETVMSVFPTVERPAGLHFDGKHLWIGGHGPGGDLNHHIYAYDPETGEEVAAIEVGHMPVALYADEHSPYLHVVCHGDHTLYQVDIKKKEVIASAPTGQNPHDVSGDANTLFVTSLDSDQVHFIDRDTFEVDTVLDTAPAPYLSVTD